MFYWPRKLVLLVLPYLAMQQVAGTQNNGVSASYRLRSSGVTLHEPLILRLEVENSSSQALQVDLGKDSVENFLVSVRGPRGISGQSTGLREPGFGVGGKNVIQPGQTFEKDILLNRWIEFKFPGKYDIEVRLTKPVQTMEGEAIQKIAPFRGIVEVLPEDLTRLREACASFEQEVENASSYRQAADAALALASIRDTAAVPYLEKALYANVLVQAILIDGLEKIDNEDAARALISAQTRAPSDVKLQARAALERMANKNPDSPFGEYIKRALEKAPNHL